MGTVESLGAIGVPSTHRRGVETPQSAVFCTFVQRIYLSHRFRPKLLPRCQSLLTAPFQERRIPSPHRSREHTMIIEVRPTPALRRHRARIVGAVAVAGLVAASVLSVAQLASANDAGRPDVTVSDRSHD